MFNEHAKLNKKQRCFAKTPSAMARPRRAEAFQPPRPKPAPRTASGDCELEASAVRPKPGLPPGPADPSP